MTPVLAKQIRALIEAQSGDVAVADSLAPDDEKFLSNHSTQRTKPVGRKQTVKRRLGSVTFSLFQSLRASVLSNSLWVFVERGVRSCNGTTLTSLNLPPLP